MRKPFFALLFFELILIFGCEGFQTSIPLSPTVTYSVSGTAPRAYIYYDYLGDEIRSGDSALYTQLPFSKTKYKEATSSLKLLVYNTDLSGDTDVTLSISINDEVVASVTGTGAEDFNSDGKSDGISVSYP
jgi:hypothetical protein